MTPRISVWGLAVWLGACGAGDATLEEVDPEAAPARPDYETHVAPIMDDYCTTCHAKDSGGEGGEVRYDSCEMVVRNWRQLERSTFDEKSMPPPTAYALSSADVLTLRRWWEQGHACP